MTSSAFDVLLTLLLVRNAHAVDVDIEGKIDSLMATMKSMPGIEGFRMFTAKELLEWEGMETDDDDLRTDPAKPRPRRTKTREEWRERLVRFYTEFGLEEKLPDVDKALDTWKGREEKMLELSLIHI